MQPSRPPGTRDTVRDAAWLVLAGAALVAAAWWLRSPGVLYLVGAGTATAAGAVALWSAAPRRRAWAVASAAVVAAFIALAAIAQQRLHRIRSDSSGYGAAIVRGGARQLGEALAATVRDLRATAARALAVPAEGSPAFTALGHLVARDPTRGVVLYRDGIPLAWAGRTVVSTDSMLASVGVARSPFYEVVFATAARGSLRAVATAVVHADPPGDQLTTAVGNEVARRAGLHAFEFYGAPPEGEGVFAFTLAPGVAMWVRPVAPGRGEAELLALEQVRSSGALLIAVAVVLYLVAAWRGERSLARRVVPLAVPLAAIALVPLNTFSSASILFDPTVYYAELGGAFTASIGALAIAASVVLLGLLLVLRARARVPSRRVALVLVVVIMAGTPSLLRALSRGVSPPPGGVSTGLWLAWEVALFLAAACLLVAAAAAGSTAARGRGLPPVLAPALAALAAVLGPVVLEAPGSWPRWYGFLWIAAIGALALTRRHRHVVLAAATVAALGAATLTWGAGVRGRTALANRDVTGLATIEPDVVAVLERLGALAAAEPAPRTAAGLVRLYMQSDLVGTGYPVALTSYAPDGRTSAAVSLDPLTPPADRVQRIAAQARQAGHPVVESVLGVPGIFLVLVVPYATGELTAVIVAPRTRLIPDDPYTALLGLTEREAGPAPYAVTLADVDAATPLHAGITRWYRQGSELHGDRLVETGRGPMRAHIEIDVRSLDTLVQRGTLVVLLDLVVIAVLWLLSAVPEGAFARWTRARARRWWSSYRARLSLALFAFFVLPAAAFALWSYERLLSEDRQARELLLRETLRTAAAADVTTALDSIGARVDTPLLLYRHGALTSTSEPLFAALAPIGEFLPPLVALDVQEGTEIFLSTVQPVGDTRALVGYRTATSAAGEPLVLAAPARGNDEALDQRRRDLGVLVLFGTVLGALAALWLSRVASRSLARPIGRLRTAALAIAAGEREPPLAGGAPEEFEPVFSAFRRMAADLATSRAALESAQRRTAAVLRNVASGVVALGPGGAVSLANPRAEALLARPLSPGTPMEAVHAGIAARARAFAAGAAEEEEFEVTHDGRQLQARLTRLTSGDGGAVLTLDDVTELARAQRVLAWGEMARQVAHEIKNPLTPIRLGVQHLKRAYGAGRADYETILDRNVERILAEIDRLDEIARGFSRYGTAPAERLPVEPLDVVGLVRDVLELERLGRSEVDWRLHGAAGPLRVLARDDELREVLLNVLENARHASASRVDVRFDRVDGRVVVEVQDDGRGIPAAVLPRLFEPHFSTRTSGSGLGLAISRRLVESWGGEIAIASQEGRGTTVRIELREAERPG